METPRRNRLDLNEPSELAIYNAMHELEKAGADPMLTEVTILLSKAKDRLGDYFDREKSKPKDNIMEKRSLFTRDGGFVTDVYIPVFTPNAEILLWGSRYFVYDKEKDKYFEGLCFVPMPTEMIGAPSVGTVGEGLTTDPTDKDLGHGSNDGPVGQNKKYLVLSQDEIAKGFVRPVRTAYLHETCKTITTMNRTIAETYARDPKFYGSTYCVHCQMHKPVGEFVWKGTDEKVGS